MKPLSPDLQTLRHEILHLAQERKGEVQDLLELLNCVAECHTLIREGLYMDALPSTRHGLYQMLLDMEEKKENWPLLSRPQAHQLLTRLKDMSNDDDLPSPT